MTKAFSFLLIFYSVLANAEPVRVVLSGAPNTGKSTIIDLLEARGWDTLKETAVDYIHLRQGMRAPQPWTEPSFQTNINHLQLFREQRVHPEAKVVFQDRSLIDSLGYHKARKQDLSAEIKHQMETLDFGKRYYSKVFFMGALPKEFLGDRFDQNEASTIQAALLGVYKDFGYTVIEVKEGPAEERADFILGELRKDHVLPSQEPTPLFSVETVKK